MAGATISTLAGECEFPDWLGYLGLGLWACEESEAGDRTLTNAWAPQLLELVSNDSHAARRLDGIARDCSERLTLGDLELVEHALTETRSRA
jgi:hypothetical protein